MAFTPEELALICDPTPFELKHAATQKLKALMERIRETYLRYVQPQHTLCPEQTDFSRGQIAKGENYEGYPYVMLDFQSSTVRARFSLIARCFGMDTILFFHSF
jgi:hypothetical protein